MPPPADFHAVAQALRSDVDGAKRGSKRMKVSTLLMKFGSTTLSGALATRIGNALHNAGLSIDPPLLWSGTRWTVDVDDWVNLSSRTATTISALGQVPIPPGASSPVSPPVNQMSEVEILEAKILKELRHLRLKTGYEFSSDHIIRHVRRHHGITLTWEQAIRFMSVGYDRLSLQTILAQQSAIDAGDLIKYGMIAVAAVVCFFLYQSHSGQLSPVHAEKNRVVVASDSPSEKVAVPTYSTPVTQELRTTPFNARSNGHTWRSASESAKRSLCERLELVSTKGNSANFYYDLLDATYDTTDSYTLQQPIDDVVRLGDAASTSLPLEQRNY